jgi:hypothetical protein
MSGGNRACADDWALRAQTGQGPSPRLVGINGLSAVDASLWSCEIRNRFFIVRFDNRA